MLSSLARYLEPLPDEEGDAFLTHIQTLFKSEFIAKQLVPDQEAGESLNISSQAEEDSLITEKKHDEGRIDSDQEAADKPTETNTTTVLHMGSVLSAEHDYLLWNLMFDFSYCDSYFHINMKHGFLYQYYHCFLTFPLWMTYT